MWLTEVTCFSFLGHFISFLWYFISCTWLVRYDIAVSNKRTHYYSIWRKYYFHPHNTYSTKNHCIH